MGTEGKNVIVTDPTGITVANNLVTLREDLRVSRQQLQERLEKNGVDLTAHAIGRIERLQRRMEVGELTAIAYALDISPSKLLTPSPSSCGLTGIPSMFDSEDIWAWLNGKVGFLHRGPLAAYWQGEQNELRKQIRENEERIKNETNAELIEVLMRQLREFEERLEAAKQRENAVNQIRDIGKD